MTELIVILVLVSVVVAQHAVSIWTHHRDMTRYADISVALMKQLRSLENKLVSKEMVTYSQLEALNRQSELPVEPAPRRPVATPDPGLEQMMANIESGNGGGIPVDPGGY
jgi:hypothetical protein